MRAVARLCSSMLVLVGLPLLLGGCPDGGEQKENGNDGPRTCLQDEDCRPGEECVGGWCEQIEEESGCLRDSDCPEGFRCEALSATCVEAETEGPEPICVPGETRCHDSLTMEVCDEDGGEWERETCEHECWGDACVICTPGFSECVDDVSRVCNEHGTGWDEQDCAALGVECQDGLCLVCSPGERRCVDEWTFELCNPSGTGWDDYACLEGHCEEETGLCIQDGCTPGRYTCHGNDRMICDADGETWVFVEDCAALDGGECVGSRCTHPCSEAVANNSYIGCEYWPVVLSNSSLDPVFHDDFAVVVSNPSSDSSAEVRAYKHGQTSPIATTSVAPGSLEIMYLPWNAMNARSGGAPISRRGFIAYRLESTIPVTAYQFNPLRSKIGSEYSHTNDASMLLPTHVFGEHSRYLAMALPHMDLRVRDCPFGSCSTVLESEMPTLLAIVATEDDTTVRLRLRGATASGDGMSDLPAGTDTTVVLNRHEVLQLASRTAGSATTETETEGSMFGHVEYRYREYRSSDLTGSIIDSDKPIAVFSGADCRFVPFNEWACDHMEQQLFPFHNWGSSYIGAVAEPPPGGDPSVGDMFRLVAAVNGTEVTFSPQVHPNRSLDAGEWIQFTASDHFRVSSQGLENPIMLTQFFVGQNAHGSSMGDPTMISAVPTEQYRSDFAFITTDTIARNYINVVRPAGATVMLNDAVLPSGCWRNVAGSYQVCRHELSGGTHTVTASSPVGLTVYGYDNYVSYGYAAGLMLQTLVGVNPGW